jgi:hypothetical protein
VFIRKSNLSSLLVTDPAIISKKNERWQGLDPRSLGISLTSRI